MMPQTNSQQTITGSNAAPVAWHVYSNRFDILIKSLSINTYFKIQTAILTFIATLFGAAVPIAFNNLLKADPYSRSINELKYAEWIRPYYFPEHKYVIAGYTLSVILISIGIIFYKKINKYIKNRQLNHNHFFATIILSLILMVEITFYTFFTRSITPSMMFINILGWIALWLAPLILLKWFLLITQNKATPKILALLFIADFLFSMSGVIGGRTPLMLEYFDIPTGTSVQISKNSPTKLVDTIDYINKNQLWGNQNLYDPRINPGQDRECLEGNYFDIKITQSVLEYVSENKNVFYVPNNQQRLCFVGEFLEQYNEVKRIISPSEVEIYNNTISKNKIIYKKFKESILNDEYSSFLKANRINIIQTIHDLELVLHHHFQILNPIHENILNRPHHEIISTYGGGFLVVQALMEQLGGIDYTRFLQVVFGSYIVYIGLFALSAQFILRDLRLTFFVSAVLMGAIKGLGFINLFAGVGYTPIRHFFDLFVLISLFSYLRYGRSYWLVLAAGFAVAGLGLDRMLGLFALAALIGVLLTRVLLGATQRPKFESIVLILTACAGGWTMVALGQVTAPNPFTSMFFDGVWGFPISLLTILFILLAYSTALFYVLSRMGNSVNQVNNSIALYLLYATCLGLFYWLMVPNYGHRNAVLPFAAFTLAVLITEARQITLIPKLYHTLATASLVIGALIWTGFSIEFLREKIEYDRYVASHQVYQWDFDRMKMSSTADPAIFKDAVSVLDQFSTKGDGIHILSQHDALLAFISDRYSKMPYFEVGMFLNGPRQQDIIVEAIKRDQPRYLFVDSCITCAIPPNFPNPRYLPDFPHAYYLRTSQKINRLQQMSEVFAKVAPDYRLVKTGNLLSVYERINR